MSFTDEDVNASNRKFDHIKLAFQSQVDKAKLDDRFYYEPLLASHTSSSSSLSKNFMGHDLKAPLWVSSMTGGTEMANTINHNLAKAAGEYGFGMGLGSCRSLLTSDEYLSDFYVKPLMPDTPLFANLGIAQCEQLIDVKKPHLIKELVKKLDADGLIIHVNPFQEWLQPEVDRFKNPPIDTINHIIDLFPNVPLIVKEVGQGMGIKSLEALLKLPLSAIEFAANGGTNFSKLELLRSSEDKKQVYAQLANIGHSASEMVQFTNDIVADSSDIQCKELIISGGVNSFLDGYYLIQSAKLNAVYGQASSFLKKARGSYDELQKHIECQLNGLKLAYNFLVVK